MVENNSFDVQVTSSSHIFPESNQGPPITVALSIIDSTVSGFARCAGIWYYGPPSSSGTSISTSHLRDALSKTLSSYPQFCGRVHFAEPQHNGGHMNRYRRVHVTYNTPTDVGVPFIIATSPKPLSDFLPNTEDGNCPLKLGMPRNCHPMDFFLKQAWPCQAITLLKIRQTSSSKSRLLRVAALRLLGIRSLLSRRSCYGDIHQGLGVYKRGSIDRPVTS